MERVVHSVLDREMIVFVVAVVIVASSPLWIAFLLFMLLRNDTPAEALTSP